MTFAILLFFVNVLWSIRNGKRAGPNPGARARSSGRFRRRRRTTTSRTFRRSTDCRTISRSRCRTRGSKTNSPIRTPPVAGRERTSMCGCIAGTHDAHGERRPALHRDPRAAAAGLLALPRQRLRAVLVVHLRLPLHAQQRPGLAAAGNSSASTSRSPPGTRSCCSDRARRCTTRSRTGSTATGCATCGFLLATIVLGVGFLGGQAYEYTHLIFGEHVTWSGSGIFGASFFTLTGMHGFHVFFGVCYLTMLVLQSATGVYTRGQVLRHHGRHAVLALRRRHLGRTVLDLLLDIRSARRESCDCRAVGAVIGGIVVGVVSFYALYEDWKSPASRTTSSS